MEQQDPKYCLYARKSSESDERQAMSIDSQIKEMTDLAERESLNIVAIKQESHSAKSSGARPLFLEMISELTQGKYNAILTWAPDRLSRNAGDLGSLVDLMDIGKLLKIRTISQSFTNNPNEKFLLMILCSQAKLENDNRGLNVKRGIRTKCEMGWRPCPAPIGYINYTQDGVKKIMVDNNVAPLIKDLFTLVAKKNYSGRDLKDYLDKDQRLYESTNRKYPLSTIYNLLKTSFYYGEFQYPEVEGGIWYKGAHEPIITKELYESVQKKLLKYSQNKVKTKWGSIDFTFKNIFKCAYCGASIIGEEKYKLLKSGSKNLHIYYHCSRQINYVCPEPYIKESDLIASLVAYVELMELNLKQIEISKIVSKSMQKYNSFMTQMTKDTATTNSAIKFSIYLSHILFQGTRDEKDEVLECIPKPLFIHNKEVIANPII